MRDNAFARAHVEGGDDDEDSNDRTTARVRAVRWRNVKLCDFVRKIKMVENDGVVDV